MNRVASAPIELPLPVLGILPNGDYSLGVPLVGDALQIGFRGKPEGISRISVMVEDEQIMIAREDSMPLQIEGSFGTVNADGRLAIERRRVLREPVPAITLRPSETPGVWTVDGDIMDPQNRVGLSRFAAKMGGTVVRTEQRRSMQV